MTIYAIASIIKNIVIYQGLYFHLLLFLAEFNTFGSSVWFWLVQIHLLLQVQDAVKCRVVDRQEEGNGDSGGSFQNGHAQLMVGKTTI